MAMVALFGLAPRLAQKGSGSMGREHGRLKAHALPRALGGGRRPPGVEIPSRARPMKTMWLLALRPECLTASPARPRCCCCQDNCRTAAACFCLCAHGGFALADHRRWRLFAGFMPPLLVQEPRRSVAKARRQVRRATQEKVELSTLCQSRNCQTYAMAGSAISEQVACA